ncbi:MAG: chloride channel protein [Actinomycetota bacterium]
MPTEGQFSEETRRGRFEHLVDRFARKVRGAGYVRKWIVLGSIIGLVAGVGAIAFATFLEIATHFFLGTLAGASPLSPFGEGNMQGAYVVLRPWALPLVVGLGGLISGLLVFGLAPEAEGHGTDAAIAAVHHSPKGIRGRVSIVKMLASAVTIGSGGSGGREGPTAQISAGFGSFLARALDLTPADARIAVTVGIASGIGAIFRAPLGGAVLGAEILYRDDFEVSALIPSVLASIVSFAVFGVVKGFTPIFGFVRGYHFQHPAELVFYVLIGLACGLVGRLYSWSFYSMTHLTARLPGARVVKVAVAGLLVGCIGLVFPGALGTGYGWVQRAMGPTLLTIPLWIVLALPFAKILSTSLSIGSGGSGGIFGPGMVIGGFLGAGIWRLLEPLAPGIVPHSPAPFVIVGMVACFGSIAHAPIAVLLMVAEMTGSLELVPPAMAAIVVATLVVGTATIYTSQLRNRSEAPANRLREGLPLLRTIAIQDALSPPPLILQQDSTVADARRAMKAAGLAAAPVVLGDRTYLGAYSPDASSDDEISISRLASVTHPEVPTDAMLDAAADVFATDHVSWVPVLDADRKLSGIVTIAGLVGAYRGALDLSLASLGDVLGTARLVDGTVAADSPLAGQMISALPHGAAVIWLERKGAPLMPQPDLALEVGDTLSILVSETSADRLEGLLDLAQDDEYSAAEDEPLI